MSGDQIQFTPRQSSSYQIGNMEVKSTTSHRDLGINVTNSFSWSDHCNTILCQKAYRSLHLLRRTISGTKRRLYVSLVRSNLTYCSQLWRPYLLKDIQKIERVQRRATKYILNNYENDYKQRLIKLHLLPIMYFYELQDIMYLDKCIKDPPNNVANGIHHFCNIKHPFWYIKQTKV